MEHEHPLKERIAQRIEDERYVIPKEEKKKQRLDFQLIVILSILISLGLVILQIIQFFFR
ncbi:TPA: hypothetical protein U0431_001554 [Streptococcus suis]|nr:hypothetical protein [Streptococcus suis]HEM2548762.1 hypothetical protein [Streptococcus suis]